MLGTAVALLGLAIGWQVDPCKNDRCQILECNPKVPSINEIESYAKCCDCPTGWKKIVFFEAAHFPNPRFSETIQGNQPGCLPLPIPLGIGHVNGNFPGTPGFPIEAIPTKYLVEQNGKPLVIHEGMAVMLNREGGYKVVFRATVPDTVVDLRLQLEFGVQNQFLKPAKNDYGNNKLSNTKPVFVDQHGKIEASSSLRAFKLTLPPIQFSRDPDNSIIFTTIPAEVNDRSRDVLVVLEGYSALLASFVSWEEPKANPAVAPAQAALTPAELAKQLEELEKKLQALLKPTGNVWLANINLNLFNRNQLGYSFFNSPVFSPAKAEDIQKIQNALDEIKAKLDKLPQDKPKEEKKAPGAANPPMSSAAALKTTEITKPILETTLTKLERNGTARFGSPITR